MAGDDVTVVANGMAYAGWKSVTIQQDFDAASGECTLIISEQPGNPLPLNLNDDVQVILGSTPAITGYVYKISGRHGWGDHDITLTIRDQTQSFIDSTVGPKCEFKPPIKLKQVLDGTLQKMGLSHIKVIDKANPEVYRQGGEVPVAAVDDTGHGWADKWTSKRQVVLNTDGKGNLVIDRNRQQRGPGMLFKGPEDSPFNNVLEATFENSLEGRHATTAAAGQKSTNDLDYWEQRPKGDQPAQANPLSKNWGIAQDTSVRPDRKFHFRGRKGLEGKSPEQAAKWRSNLARSRNLSYEATVQGFEMAPGQLWWPGFVIPVFDYHFQISDEMFIKGVEFSKDWDGGAKTKIKCTVKDAFSESGAAAPGQRTSKGGIGSTQTGAFPADDISDLE